MTTKSCLTCKFWTANRPPLQPFEMPAVPATWGICKLPQLGLQTSPMLVVPRLLTDESNFDLHTRNDFHCAGFTEAGG